MKTHYSLRISLAILLLSWLLPTWTQAQPGAPAAPTIVTQQLPAAVRGQAYAVQLRATGGVPPYRWSFGQSQSQNTPGFSISSDGVLSGTAPAGLIDEVYGASFRVTDANNSSTSTVLRFAVQRTPLIGENIGGGATGIFAAERSNDAQSTIVSTTQAVDTAGVDRPAPIALYQTARTGTSIVQIAPAGTREGGVPRLTPGVAYLVRLHFAEIEAVQAGQRQFNVVLNGQQVLTNFDIVQTAGARNKAVVQEFIATAVPVRTPGSIGTILIEVKKGAAGQPLINGFEILPATIFELQTPALTDVTDNRSYELSTTFRAAPGEIRALRYWKAPSETGTHVGRLWSNTGVLLATATFTNETASGWQQATLATPFVVDGFTTYRVSVNANSHYVATTGGLNTLTGIGNGYVTAYSSNYGDAGQFPTNTYQSTNYFRDVAYVPAAQVNSTTRALFASQFPSNPSLSEGQSYELGVKLRSSEAGRITAVRYWKATGETGSHTGRIWSATGELLGTVNFANESAFGWQQADLTTPVPMQANTDYVISVNANTHYAFTPGRFSNTTLRDAPVTANLGVFSDAIGAFPASTYNGNDYFRSIVFDSSPAQSSTAPNSNVKAAVAMYPNPTTGALFIEGLATPASYSVQVTNAYGKEFPVTTSQRGDKVLEVNLSALPRGTYLVKTVSQSKVSVTRIERE